MYLTSFASTYAYFEKLSDIPFSAIRCYAIFVNVCVCVYIRMYMCLCVSQQKYA